MNMRAVRVWMMKSVSAGEYAAPPAHGPGDDRDLRDHAGEQHVVVEDPAVAGQRVDALLDPGAAGVVDEDERACRSSAHACIIAATLSECTSPAEPPATVKSWLATWTGRPSTVPAPVTTPSAGRSVLGHPEVGRLVLGEHAGLLEAARVEQARRAARGR